MSIARRRTAALAVPLLLAGLALNGCGVADTQVRPGLAAYVDGTEIKLGDVDKATTALCDYYGSGAFDGARAFPRSLQRRDIAQSFILKAALEQIVADRDLALPDSYGVALAAIDKQIAGQPHLDDLASAYRANAYVSAAAIAIGDDEFAADGTTAGSEAESQGRGSAVAGAWLAVHDVDINPVLALDLTDTGLAPVDDDLSVAQSDIALAAVLDLGAPDVTDKVTALAATLPDDQVCGA